MRSPIIVPVHSMRVWADAQVEQAQREAQRLKRRMQAMQPVSLRAVDPAFDESDVLWWRGRQSGLLDLLKFLGRWFAQEDAVGPPTPAA